MKPYISCRMAYITFPFTIFRFECQRKEFITSFEFELQRGVLPSESPAEIDFGLRQIKPRNFLVGGLS